MGAARVRERSSGQCQRRAAAAPPSNPLAAPGSSSAPRPPLPAPPGRWRARSSAGCGQSARPRAPPPPAAQHQGGPRRVRRARLQQYQRQARAAGGKGSSSRSPPHQRQHGILCRLLDLAVDRVCRQAGGRRLAGGQAGGWPGEDASGRSRLAPPRLSSCHPAPAAASGAHRGRRAGRHRSAGAGCGAAGRRGRRVALLSAALQHPRPTGRPAPTKQQQPPPRLDVVAVEVVEEARQPAHHDLRAGGRRGRAARAVGRGAQRLPRIPSSLLASPAAPRSLPPKAAPAAAPAAPRPPQGRRPFKRAPCGCPTAA